MATSVSSTTTNAATSTSTTAVTTSNTTSTSAGISTATSSISSAADNQGFSAQISAWVANVMDTIRNCLAKLPVIGHWFEKSTPATTTTPTTTPLTTTWTDAELLAMIRGQFVAAGGTTTTTTIAAPAADVVAYALNNFSQIQSPVTKMDAFMTVLSAVNSTDDIARQFYNGLPEGNPNVEASRSAFRNQLWIENGRTSIIGGVDQGMNFGDHIIGNAPRGPLAQQAAQALRTALAAAVTTSTTTSTTTAASTSTTTAATSSTTVLNRAADAGYINSIRNILTAADAAGTAVTAPSLANIVNLFTQIQGPVTKMDAFQMVLTATRSTPALMQQCFAALPVGTAATLEASQEAVKFQMYEANGRSSVIGLVDHGMNFGNHVIGNVGGAPCDLLTRTAATNLRALLAA